MSDPHAQAARDAGRGDFFPRRLPFVVMGGAGALFFVIGLFVSWNAVSFTMRSVTAEGRVTGVDTVDDSSNSSRSRMLYYPMIEFTDSAGGTHEFRGDVSRSSSAGGGSRSSAWQEGDRVIVRYDPANADDARMAGGWSVLPHLFVILGMLAMAIAWFAARAQRRMEL